MEQAPSSLAASCVERLGQAGGLPGSWGASLDSPWEVWSPSDAACASQWSATAARSDDAALVAGRTLWFLGDSVLRDLAVSLQQTRLQPPHGANDASPDSDVDARLRAKKGCRKTYNDEREAACRVSYAGGATGRFMWLQWLHSPHRIPFGLAPGRGTGYQQQEIDACCAWTHGGAAEAPGSAGLRACLSALFRNVSARDILILRSGLNYPLYAPEVAYESESLQDWRAAMAEDFAEFLGHTLPAVFPGTVVLWQLDPGIDRPGLHPSCDSEGALHRLAPLLATARTLQAAAVAAARAPGGGLAGRLHTVDPSNIVAAEAEMGRLYIDCLHHSAGLQSSYATALFALLREANLPG